MIKPKTVRTDIKWQEEYTIVLGDWYQSVNLLGCTRPGALCY